MSQSPFHPIGTWPSTLGTCLRQVLREAGYNQEALAGLLNIQRPGDDSDSAYVLRRTAERTPLNFLVRLFYLGQTVGPDWPRPAGFPLQQLLDVGILRSEGSEGGEGLSAVAKLAPYKDLLVFSDFKVRSDDHVLGVGGASVTLARLTPRRRIERALDVGTGSGVQAMLAAGHAGAAEVVGTDINARALNFAAAGAAVTGLGNIQWRLGSLYEPVCGEQFDLITANPPFVISPETSYKYRDSGMPGDEISRAVISGAADHLRPGGLAVVIFNWHHDGPEDWAQRPLEWVAASGCDAWLMKFKTLDSLTYAVDWLRTSQGPDTNYDPGELDRWLDYHHQQGIRSISGGVIILQRRAASNWRRTDDLQGIQGFGDCSAQLVRILANETFLAELPGVPDPPGLLDRPVRLVEEHHVEQVLKTEAGRWSVRSARLAGGNGIDYGGEVDAFTMGLLAGCDGTRSVRKLLEDLAGKLESPVDKVLPDGLKLIMKLMRTGLLVVSEGNEKEKMKNEK